MIDDLRVIYSSTSIHFEYPVKISGYLEIFKCTD